MKGGGTESSTQPKWMVLYLQQNEQVNYWPDYQRHNTCTPQGSAQQISEIGRMLGPLGTAGVSNAPNAIPGLL